MEDTIIQQLIEWAQGHEAVHAVVLTSTRARPGAALDPFSDYDVILAVTEVAPFFVDRGWLGHFGTVLVVYRDPIRTQHGYERFTYVTQYEHDRLKIDFTVMQAALLRRAGEVSGLRDELDAGYQVLLDKDHVTDTLPQPTYRAYIPTLPTQAAYHEAVEVFFHEATYVAKNLWRDELLPAKYSFDQVMKQGLLRQMLEWRMEIDHGWSVKTGVLGKGLKRYVSPERWATLESTYVGVDIDENWAALFTLMTLYREVAVEVGAALGYDYPHALDERMQRYLHGVKALQR